MNELNKITNELIKLWSSVEGIRNTKKTNELLKKHEAAAARAAIFVYAENTIQKAKDHAKTLEAEAIAKSHK